MPHLLVTISGHGLGHLAQTGPVLQAMQRRRPDLRLTVVSTLPQSRLRERIGPALEPVTRALDFGFLMHDAFRIDHAGSARAYQAFHADWPARVRDTASWLRAQSVDLVLANAAYLPLAAAAEAGIPALGLSSLNWFDLAGFAFAGQAWAEPVLAEMLAAYRSAAAFIVLTPGMPMTALGNTLRVGPVARVCAPRRAALRERLALADGEKAVLIAFGGFDRPLPMADWPLEPGVRWLVPSAWGIRHPRVVASDTLGWAFGELVASVDALIGKPGYGTFAEAACGGTPLLYAPRPDWPEQDALVAWIGEQACARQVSDADLQAGRLAAPLAALWAQARPTPPLPVGDEQAAEIILRWL